MKRDTLFLLPPGFEDRGQRQYCPECAEIWGVLAYYPAIRDTLNFVYQPVAHPRSGLVDRLGEGRWNCPTLVLGGDNPDGPNVQHANGQPYLDNAKDIGRYWAAQYGTAHPR